MPNDISALRESLFAVLAGLKSGEIKIDQAKAINETAQTLINTAKVEVDFMRASGKTIDSDFLPSIQAPDTRDSARKSLTASGQQTTAPTPGGNVITHRMRG